MLCGFDPTTVRIAEVNTARLTAIRVKYGLSLTMHFPSATLTGSVVVWQRTSCRTEVALLIRPLVIVLRLPVADTEQVVLKHFAMDEECQSKKERVELEVVESYAYDVFRIMCAFHSSPKLLVQYLQ